MVTEKRAGLSQTTFQHHCTRVGNLGCSTTLLSRLRLTASRTECSKPIRCSTWAIRVFTLVYFMLNTWLMATVVAFAEGRSPLEVWRHNFLWLFLSFLSGASVSILLLSVSREMNLMSLAVILPLLVVSYLTYHTSMARVEDANRHLDQLNHLYLTTIETLAMAIDAKDQVTHGHIRRVQEQSVCLAREMGVKDEQLIKAIAAASLLHDLGKLAIPEAILNKPGKLTTSEFEVMKTHTSVGADILAAIEFPYPVVPIARHHHEHWDGSGYPDDLSSTEIPIGARILSVVDCFDALTSDRPYRSRLTDDEAVAILQEGAVSCTTRLSSMCS